MSKSQRKTRLIQKPFIPNIIIMINHAKWRGKIYIFYVNEAFSLPIIVANECHTAWFIAG